MRDLDLHGDQLEASKFQKSMIFQFFFSLHPYADRFVVTYPENTRFKNKMKLFILKSRWNQQHVIRHPSKERKRNQFKQCRPL